MSILEFEFELFLHYKKVYKHQEFNIFLIIIENSSIFTQTHAYGSLKTDHFKLWNFESTQNVYIFGSSTTY